MTEEIIQLSDYAHVRFKTEMYFGSRNPHTQEILSYDENNLPVIKETTWVPALYTAFREIFDNALDEVVGHGHGNCIDVEFDEKQLRFLVRDNGRGIPIDIDEKTGQHMATIALTRLRAGRNFADRKQVAGTNGIGASGTNFCSEWMTLTIHRDGCRWEQSFHENLMGFQADDIMMSEPRIVKVSGNKTGTQVECKLSREVFEKIPKLKDNMILPEDFIRSRIVEIAAVNPQVKFTFNGEKIKVNSRIEKNFFENAIHLSVVEEDFSSDFYLVPNFLTDGEFYHSIVNNIPAFNGGSHMDGFRRSFYKNLLSELKTEIRKRKLTPNNSDIQQRLLVYNVTRMKAPDFDSQSKTRLINEHAQKIVQKHLDNSDVYKQIIKKNSQWIDEIFRRCAERTHKKDAEEIKKLNKKNLRNKIAKLNDATGKDRSKCILIVTEGDSAVAGMMNVRDPSIHAGMPVRGKVMNVYDLDQKRILANEELSNLMSAIGLSLNVRAVRSELNFGKVFIAADMDHDGANITALMINFFYKFWPELFDPSLPAFFYIFQTPFIIAERGNERKYWYARNHHEFDPIEYSKSTGWEVSRAKGLGTLNKEDWAHSLKNPELIPVLDDGKLNPTLDLIFNPNRADDRKEWMQ
jgi:DNA gyrase/topoisomerase IV subunit B